MEAFLCQIVPFGGNFAIRGWAQCNGQLLAIAQQSAVFSLMGTTFGGDGRSTFGLPELRGRTMVHPGSGPGLTTRMWGQRGGREYTILTQSQMPQHTHQFIYNPTGGTSGVTVKTTLKATTQEGTISVPEENAFLSATKEEGSKGGGPDFMYVKNSEIDASKLVELNGVSSIAAGGGGFEADKFQILNNGSSQPVYTESPFMGIYHEIALVGLFPSRS